MRGFGSFIRKELAEILRTWRIWVLPGIVLFFALSGAPLAKVTPQLIGSLMADQQSGVVIQLPDPTYVEAYAQWTSNLAEIVLFAIIIMFGGMVSGETKSGTAALVLTKPLSRRAFVVAKFVSHALLVTAPVALGMLVTWGTTYAIFGEAPFAPLVQATAVWLAFGLFFVAVMELMSCSLDSHAGASGLGIAVYALIGLTTLWKPALEYSPAGLLGVPTEIVMAEGSGFGSAVVATLMLTAALVVVAMQVFERREF